MRRLDERTPLNRFTVNGMESRSIWDAKHGPSPQSIGPSSQLRGGSLDRVSGLQKAQKKKSLIRLELDWLPGVCSRARSGQH